LDELQLQESARRRRVGALRFAIVLDCGMTTRTIPCY
jgi:hypothetical protein